MLYNAYMKMLHGLDESSRASGGVRSWVVKLEALKISRIYRKFEWRRKEAKGLTLMQGYLRSLKTSC